MNVRQPVQAGQAVPEPVAFRAAMAEVVHAVHIITTSARGGAPGGMVATAVASVSDDPPTVLACIVASSRTLAAIEANGVFCINTLAATDLAIAERFAGRSGLHGEERFEPGRWSEMATGSPVLDTALASFDCRLEAVHPVATHHILIGRVMALGGSGGGAGLVYHRRAFGAV